MENELEIKEIQQKPKRNDHFGPDLGVKDITQMPAPRPGRGSKI